ncbi:hypothetical protein BOX15_Mlig004493g2 [Macrostomum lignano]|uniref:Saposin B-type domain-containing protein n=1 Tax=Macrostomum lignano TaxID=282301 RepID=A0A267EFP7_9PLAT|nr:hypothetical protein BOX15_Mlig004493g2 [Macrostomum lignano]
MRCVLLLSLLLLLLTTALTAKPVSQPADADDGPFDAADDADELAELKRKDILEDCLPFLASTLNAHDSIPDKCRGLLT